MTGHELAKQFDVPAAYRLLVPETQDTHVV
jgi:hypothetical protein